jgi:hypothetical protein
MNFKHLWLPLLCLLGVGAARAEAPHQYAVVSLAGDAITVMTASPETGTNLHTRNKVTVPITGVTLDKAAVDAVAAYLKKNEPAAGQQPMLTQDSALIASRNAMFEQPEMVGSRERLASMWQGQDISHLILITPLHTEIEVKFVESHQYRKSMVDGIGFYLDNFIHIVNRETGEHNTGIIMPFAYLKLRLVDAHSMQVLKEVAVKESMLATHKKEGPASLRVWDALTPEEKVHDLERVIWHAVEKGLPQLLKTAE